ncbi:FkbM family methyltransferase, partial [Candidatus Bathyarchaeota archaeon]|nr:FkbM family methyltransferase [Candidatus Bathyarchaeota archaeon]
ILSSVFKLIMPLVKGRQTTISFKDLNGHLYVVIVSMDQLLMAVKDVLLVEEYEMLTPFNSCYRHRLVVDAGAHVGLYSLKMMEKAEKIIALEPEPRNYKLLLENIYRNHAYAKIIPLRVALWKKRGLVKLFKGSDTSMHSLFGTGEMLKVPAIEFSQIIDRYGDIDLLKMDIEGAEYQVLLSMKDNELLRVKKIVAELHPLRDYKVAITKIIVKLKRLGFNVSVVKPPISQPLSYTVHRITGSRLVNPRWLKPLAVFFYAIGKLMKARSSVMMLYALRLDHNERTTS